MCWVSGDASGNDLAMPACGVTLYTIRDCYNLCSATSGCVQFTYLGSVFSNPMYNHKCCLKNAVGAITALTGATSGLRGGC